MAKNAASRSNWKPMSPPMILNLADSTQTEVLGSALAQALPGVQSGAVVYLEGDLGAGKTTCARSLLRRLGVTGPVRSPTYTLVDTYNLAALTCVHVDLYRVQSLQEVEELGLRDLTGGGYLMLIEWPEKGGSAVPEADIQVSLRYAGEGRMASIAAFTRMGEHWLSQLERDNSLTPYVPNLT
jgi:tRNA threonylcarbamoyladenosine biosynthesis protein TsaE